MIAIVAQTGDMYAGLWYAVVFALVTVVIGGLFLRSTVISGIDAVALERAPHSPCEVP